ncbi:MAG: hypothetical protein ACYTG4_15685, partial [Planctomycetota bacterium]
DPSPGAFVRNVMVSTVGLVLVVLVHGVTEGQAVSADRVLRLVPVMFGLSVVLWGVATSVSVLRRRRAP